MDNNLPELERKDNDAAKAFEGVRGRWDARKRELDLEARRKLEEELGEEFRLRQDERAKASAAWRKERERVDVALGQEDLPFPEGTVLVEWHPENWDWDGRSFRRTGATGVLQVHRSSDPRPDNVVHVRLVAGQLVVRHLLAGGKPGKKAVAYAKGLWLREGEVHPRCKLFPCPSCGRDRPGDGVGNEKFAQGTACPHCGHETDPAVKA